MVLWLDRLELRYDPYPIGLIRPILPDDQYLSYVDAFPPPHLLRPIPKVGNKTLMSERFTPKEYKDWVANTPLWREFYRWIKSGDFIDAVLTALRERHVDLGLRNPSKPVGFVKQLRRMLRARQWSTHDGLSARFEFSEMPADGGLLLPHTDNPEKIITLVVSMVRPGDWSPELGGGLDINRPRRPELAFNHLNRKARFADMDVLHTYEFAPNQGVLFVKTFNSWHSVAPMHGPAGKLRRTLTINIETLA